MNTSVAIMAYNVIKVWRAATKDDTTQGLEWYREAHEIARTMAHESGRSLETCAGVIAYLSINSMWQKNKFHALRMAREVGRGQMFVNGWYATTNKWRDRAWEHLNRDLGMFTEDTFTGGFKVRAFQNNIVTAGRSEMVTCDRWARHAAELGPVNNGKSIPTPSSEPMYRRIEEAYRLAAKILRKVTGAKITSPELQAVVWIAIRRINGFSWA